MSTSLKKLFISGGHLTPALSAIDEIRMRKVPWEIVFIGRKTSMEGFKDEAHEEREVHAKNIRFLPLIAGRLQRTLTINTINSLFKIPIGFIQAIYYCLRERPDAVLSFGGYVALPIVVSAAFFHIPVISHEQTSVPGLANKIIALYATKICVTFEETRTLFPKNKVVFTGLPVRNDMFISQSQPSWVKDTLKSPIIYITGGSTGSTSLNALIFPLISCLTEKYFVIHQTGRLSFDQAILLKQKNYILKDYFEIEEVSWIFQHAALIVGRSGANTVMEIAMTGNIGLFIPLPWSGGGEQMKNAQWLEKQGTAEILPQAQANPGRLMQNIQKILSASTIYGDRAKKLSLRIQRDGAKLLIDEVARFV